MILMKNITRDGNPVLRKVAQPLTFPLNEHYRKLADDMMEYLINSQDPKIAEKHQLRAGVGLAAPQVGESVQMASLLVPNDKGEIVFKETFVNPEILSESVRQACLSEGEGCLSVDRVIDGYVLRPDKLKIRYYTVDGEEKTIRLKDYPAIVASHEIEHLRGHLFYDRINKKQPFKLDDDTVVIY
ncbi:MULTISPECIES: peptide deformylase [unclassified Lactobacillus]|uniref:peptide deformylase n=1 Tax=unclassified Lactobacillus TaxID=2620435 RepID=UPI000EFD4690|nr:MULTISPECIES: peptide deformylase [unclassified Lactobacillus]RMC25130.1 peptide deformylase [Lactobacillus sp. ESL0247]RMC29284.1 peptide deformylase [Lactobacillus sp. ESL0246]RMC32305.1 peptide deformylase [Lactobacillus sp. ESL0245]